ncbi:MAG: type VI secretion system baseplate subunit TssE [Deltaproteobacteria bacterium]|jgi:type VI secretion system protein|nr:type VI secretion system baseplate subunit TssE [Myxococcales bacterium]MDP3213374.1 type VI secretion system baseplate subunit TssE [Deltaproteobacteria bacterium]
MAGRGLLSRISAKDITRTRTENDVESIIEHLRGLLNTRQGECPAAMDFGVVDFTDLMHTFPEAIQTLQRSIRATILQYEPRLKNVIVQHVRDDEVLVLKFQITAQLASKTSKGAVRLETQLRAGGQISVR